ncbi:nicotinate-nucleotide adenylyltransferase [Eubacterium oxidoreducens]|nr:nicotinate-nucleotide adenylyltransferase [Eubacterium oxidoreducens]
MRKIGILGGTFDPVHNGHLLIADNAMDEFQLDEVWFIPNGNSPHKNNIEITDQVHRYQMLQLATCNHNDFYVNDYELHQNEICYTYKTLEYLVKEYPDDKFYFLMGADSLDYFMEWKKPERICELSHILVTVRDDLDDREVLEKIKQLKTIYQANADLIKMTAFSVSSSDIRRRVKNKRSIRYLVPESVRNYIEKEKLYL